MMASLRLSWIVPRTIFDVALSFFVTWAVNSNYFFDEKRCFLNAEKTTDNNQVIRMFI